MPDLTTLTALQERLRAAAGPDREMDAEIWCVVFAPDVVVIDHGVQFPPFTGSVDAALALIAKASGGRAMWRLQGNAEGSYDADVYWPLRNIPPRAMAIARTPAIALLLALVAALIAQEKANG